MKRVKKTFLHEANLWDQHSKDANSWSLPGLTCNPAFTEGRIAYAREQRQQYLDMHKRCEDVWTNVDNFIANEGHIEVIPTTVIHDEEETV